MNATSEPARPFSSFAQPSVIELRHYRLQPGAEGDFIALFEREFIETQEAVGMSVLGQFRSLDAPDRFIWLRGFADMETRRAGLTAFYMGGAAWAAHGRAANAMMIDSDNVLLLKPAWREAGLLADAAPPPPDAPAPDCVYLATQRFLDAPADGDFIAAQRERQTDPPLVAALTTETAANNFPRLPVRAKDFAFVTLERFSSRSEAERRIARDATRETGVSRIEHLLLAPAPRSRLR